LDQVYYCGDGEVVAHRLNRTIRHATTLLLPRCFAFCLRFCENDLLPRVGARPLSVRVVAWKGGASLSASTWQRFFTLRFCGAAPAAQQNSVSSHEHSSSLQSYLKLPTPLRNCPQRISPRQGLWTNPVTKSPKQQELTRLNSRHCSK
jgi:hypothetical protein